MTNTENVICDNCGANEKDDLVIRVENHFKNSDHSDRTVPTGYICMHCGYSNTEEDSKVKLKNI